MENTHTHKYMFQLGSSGNVVFVDAEREIGELSSNSGLFCYVHFSTNDTECISPTSLINTKVACAL